MTRPTKTLRTAGLSLAALAALAVGRVRPVAAQADSTAAVDTSTAALQPGDVLRLHIWLEPDWSGDFAIDAQGLATLPRLGPTRVAGIPTDQLERQLVERYREYLNNPSIEVIPLRQISVVGAVKSPGIYPVGPSVTLGQVSALAGGPLPESQRSVLELRRNGAVRRIDLSADPDLARLALRSGDQVYVPERSWLSRNAQWVVSTLVGLAGTTVYLITR